MAIEIAVSGEDGGTIYRPVVGHALILVTKEVDGGLEVSRVIGINADSYEDNQVVVDFIKQVETKLAELFPEEEKPPVLWVPE